MPVKHLTSLRQMSAVLRKLGYAKSEMQMSRNATTYTQGGSYSSRLSITVAPHGGFIILDFVKKPFNWAFSSALLGVENLRPGVADRLEQVMRRLDALQIPRPAEMTQFDLIVAIVRGSIRDVN